MPGFRLGEGCQPHFKLSVNHKHHRQNFHFWNYRQQAKLHFTLNQYKLTNPLETEDVVNQYAVENELSEKKKEDMLRIAVGSLPWFFVASLATIKAVSITTSLIAAGTAPVAVCDPAFVAEIPNTNGALLKIGHFDKIDGVTHVEL